MLRGGIYALALIILFYLFVALLEYFGNFNSVVRTILFYTCIFSSFFILIKYVCVPLSKLYKLGKIISKEEAAIIIGKHFWEVKDKLLNVLQLQNQSAISGSQSANYELIEAAIAQKISELNPIPFSAAINLSENKKYLKYAIPPLLLLLILLIGAPAILRDSTTRLIRHNEYFAKQALFQFHIENEKMEAAQQDDFELNVSLTGEEIPQEVFIEIAGNRFKMTEAKGQRAETNLLSYKYIFKNIQKTTSFRLFADEFYSKEYELIALPNPLLLNFEVNLNYPGYAGKKNETLKNTGDLLIPEGTKVTWNFKTQNTDLLTMRFHQNVTEYRSDDLLRATKPDTRASQRPDTLLTLIPTNENTYSYSEQFLQNVTYSISTQNKFLKSRDSIRYAISVIPDLYPTIEVEEKQDSLSTKILYFRGNIKDDYGFKKLTFNYSLMNESEDRRPKTEAININVTSTAEQFFYVWDLNLQSINAGDEVEYYFEIWDNDAVNGSKSTTSEKRMFKAPTLDELAEKRESKNQETKADFQESIREAKELQRELEKLQAKLVEKKIISWEEKKLLRDLLERQKQLEEKMNEMQNENQKNLREQMEYNEMSQTMMEKQQKIQDLFEKIMTEEMKKQFEELQKMMDKIDKEKLQDMVEQMKLSEKDIEKELDRTLELFKQMELEQKLQENIEKLERLAEKQEQLSEKPDDKNSANEEQKQEQEKLNEEFKEFRKDMNEMEKKNNELQFPKDMENTDSQEQKIQDSQQNSSEQLQKNDKKKASQSQKNASQKMNELSAQMKQMQQKMQEDGYEEDLDAMRQLLENLVNLSFAQEKLLQQMKSIDRNDPKYVKIGQQQKNLKDDAKLIEDSLFALSKRVPDIEPHINREMSAINDNIQQILRGFTDRNTPVISAKQQMVMTSANNLALLFDEIVQKMQQNMSSQKFGNASCNKPGMGMPSPSQSRQAQEKLNRQIQKMKGQLEKEGGNKKEPGKRGQSGGMSEQLARMAAEQEAIRNEMRKIASGMSDKEGDGGGKGKLDELQKLMEETEKNIVNKNITQETIQRQQEILTRLLEHEKSEREREMDNKRESHESRIENTRNPAEFFEYNRIKQKEAELLRTVPPSLTPFYKNKVNEYFNAIP